MYSIPECLEAIRSVGFELVEYEDMADPQNEMAGLQDPWYTPLLGSYSLKLDDLYNWRMNPVGRLYIFLDDDINFWVV